MSKEKEKAARDQLATGATDNGGKPVVNPDSITKSTKSQDFLEIAYGHGCALLDDIELGLDDSTLTIDLQALNRVRTANLNAEENQALNVLLANEIKQRAEGVQRQAISILELKDNYDELSALADALGVLPAGATWADMVERLGPITWDWQPWLAPGFLALVASEPGQGKSMLCLRIAACFLRGDPWPDGQPYTGETGAVVWCEAEAAQALNLERAKDWGLPLDKLYTPLEDPLADVQLDLSEHQEAVTTLFNRPDVKLMVVDSLRGAHRGDENSSASMEVVKMLAEMARNAGKPILLTHHLRKKGMFDLDGGVNLERVRGSSAIIQTARLVWAIDKPDVDSDTRRLSVIKNNMARFPDPVGLDIGDLGLSFGEAPEEPSKYTELDKAADFLLDLLDREPIWQRDVEQEAKGAGLAWSTVRRAKKKLRIISNKSTDDQKWYWALPAEGPDNAATIH